jgi:uncharacterized protein (DUF885 family)
MKFAPALLAALPLFAGVPAAAGPAELALGQLFADERAFTLREDPVSATAEGVRDYDDRLPSVTPSDWERRLAADEAFLRRLHAIDPAGLASQDRVNYDLFDFMVSQRIALARHRDWRIPLNSDSGFYADVLLLPDYVNPRTTLDYERYVARLEDLPRYFDENVANMRAGLRDGYTLPSEILEGVAKVVAGTRFERAEDSPLYAPFEAFPSTVPEADRARLAAAGREAIERSVMPAYAKFRKFFDEEYRPGARRTIAASDLPGGRAYYEDLVRYFTTLPDATPDAIHATGLAEVGRIRREMETIVREVGFDGSFDEFLAFLRSDPQFYARTPEQLLREAAWITRVIDGQAPKYFGRLPRTPYTVKPVPEQLAPNYTAGRYSAGPMGSAGEYWVNTYALEKRPLYALPALTLHEAVPGHHLQGALGRELENVPAFRRNFYPHAFGEGWALYGEKLGVEMGVYRTPYEHFGRLTYEMWRAARLVVDTGMHWKGWTRQQSIDFLTANTALSTHEIRTEVDRYIAWPGQALAYKTGEMEILRLRAKAEAALGPKFDIRAFHDAVLESGGVTLPVLQKRIEAFIAERAQAEPVAKSAN